MHPKIKDFFEDCDAEIKGMGEDHDVQGLSRIWLREITRHKYAYHFTWLGRPAIQFPQDMIATQELIWQIKPDLIIETGVAHGGSILFYASLLELIHPQQPAYVLGIDIDIREHNRAEIENHPYFHRVRLLEGSSVSPEIIQEAQKHAADKKKIMVILDSNHTHEHVLKELEAYGPLVSHGSYCVVMDTVIELMPTEFFANSSWGIGNNPKTAVTEYLKHNPHFSVDESIDHKLLISAAPGGYLKCQKP